MKIRFLPLVILLVVNLVAFSHPARGSYSYFTPVQTQDCKKSPADVEFVRQMKDYGLDFAIVVSPQADIREEANLSSKSLRSVKRSEFLALVKRSPVRSWYRVVEVESATEGWINECDVIIKLTANSSAGPPMEEESTGTTADPVVSVRNMEPKTDLRLRLNDVLYVIPANTTKTLTVKPGRYDFYGYSPGIQPAFGNKDFKAGHKYTWTFQIINR